MIFHSYETSSSEYKEVFRSVFAFAKKLIKMLERNKNRN